MSTAQLQSPRGTNAKAKPWLIALASIGLLALLAANASVASGAPTVSSAATPPTLSIWTNSSVPTVADNGADLPVELGVQFTSSSSGTITGIRFYKSSLNTGTHVGNLWSSAGILLATATFTNETASGWQQVNFSAPVAITANTTYVASYHTNVGHYSADQGFFSTAGVSNPPLQALASGVNGGNGLYMYGNTSSFPSNTYRAANYWVDVAFAPATTSCPCTIWSNSSVPTVTDNGADSPVELGVQFTSSSSGTITGIRFYKSSANTGTHVGNLWSSAGILLATATFTNETASGWQQVNFSAPVAITANTTYVASYHTNVGHYSADQGFFSTAGVSNPPLQALASGVKGGNGLYMYGNTSSFPSNTYHAANYWVDVTFTPATTSCPCTIWSNSSVPTTADNGPDSPVELGVQFTSSSSGTITGIRFYKSSANTGTHVGNLWSSTGTLLATATFSGETASGWQQMNFSSPVTITANTTYVASYHTNVGHFSADEGFFSRAGVSDPPLQALASEVNGGNGVYLYGNTSGFPNNSYDSSNYWVDVIFSQSTAPLAVAAASPTVTPGQITASAASLIFGNVVLGSSASQTLTVSNTGGSNVTVSNLSVSGPGFNVSGLPIGTVLVPGQSTTLDVTFTPASSGAVAGSIALVSNASNATDTVTFSGVGTQPPTVYSVDLSWAPSSTPGILSYDVYRGTVAGGPYSFLTSVPVTSVSYVDTTAQVGQIYYYVVTSISANNVQSSYSNVATAIVQ
jgi:hypothetical protein